MEYLKFVFYAVLFVIYIVSQVRKMKKKAEGEKALQPQPVKPYVTKAAAPVSKKVFDYKGKREMKTRERKPLFSQQEIEHKSITYKPVADEELIAEALLQDRKIEEKALKEERKPLAEEQLKPYTTDHSKGKMNLDWLKDKANLKRTFIAAEIFQRKY
ncbi:MAG: hypothetical protein H7282_14100 [Cytophagaceae bacterium]|nr:hypothetical protein [Cytophagaceae bacterium]